MSASPPKPPADILLAPNPTGIARAAELINAGKLVVLPTETVYGIAVNLGAATAREAARQIKKMAVAEGAAPQSRWVVHVGQAEQAIAWAGGISALGKRMMTKLLPGPVAFDVKLDAAGEAAARERLGDAGDETIGEGRITLRCPDFSATQEVLAAAASPVAIVGAGTSAQPGVFEARDVPAHLLEGAGVGAILDGGATRYRKSSTLVRLDGDQFSVVRVGVIDERIIQRMADFTILFLCSGNTCRSPMAAAIAAKMLADRLHIAPNELPLRHIVVQSAGLHTSRGLRAALEAMDAVKTMGADLSTHLSQPASPDLLRRADVVYTMTGAHRHEVVELYPWAARKTVRLDPDGDIADPIGSSGAVYQRVAGRLSAVLEKRLSEISL